MPNWCHNTLKVEGPDAAVRVFAEKVRNPEQALTFTAHAPEPSEEVYREMEERAKVRCDLCGGTGTRPTTAEEAQIQGAKWEPYYENIEWLKEQRAVAVAVRPKCNVCQGEGRMVPFHAGWYDWRIAHWGTKWDASFSGPFLALGTEESNVDATVAMQGSFQAPGFLQYAFDTAWSPPTAWLEVVAEQEPELKLTLEYGEPGMEFAGRAVAEGGEIISDEEVPIDQILTEEEMWF